MLVRYRYRIDPTPGQRQALARAFGCARVVYNDALAERRRAYLAGEKLSDTEIQRRVITQAKRTPERAWLAEVASVALVQACQDARRAYRNWFDSRSGRRKGRRVGQPEVPDASTAVSRSGSPATASPCTGPGCMWPRSARCGCAGRGRCRRCHPASPSSASRTAATTPRSWSSGTRPRCRRWRVPPGSTLAWPGWLRSPASDGTVEQVANPRHLRAAQRQLARAQRAAHPEAEGIGQPRQGPGPGRDRAPQGPRPAGRSPPQARPAADPREPSGRRRGLVRGRAWHGPGWPRASTTPDGQPWSGCWRTRPPSTGAGSSRSVAGSRPPRSARPAGPGRPQAAQHPRLGLPGMRGRPGPRRQRGPQHPCRRRAGGDAKRLWRQCQPRATPGSCQRSRNPPRRRMSGAAGIPAVHGGEEVKAY